MTDVIDNKLRKVWDDFTVKDTASYSTVLDTASTNASDKAQLLALSFFWCIQRMERQSIWRR